MRIPSTSMCSPFILLTFLRRTTTRYGRVQARGNAFHCAPAAAFVRVGSTSRPDLSPPIEDTLFYAMAYPGGEYPSRYKETAEQALAWLCSEPVGYAELYIADGKRYIKPGRQMGRLGAGIVRVVSRKFAFITYCF